MQQYFVIRHILSHFYYIVQFVFLSAFRENRIDIVPVDVEIIVMQYEIETIAL